MFIKDLVCNESKTRKTEKDVSDKCNVVYWTVFLIGKLN